MRTTAHRSPVGTPEPLPEPDPLPLLSASTSPHSTSACAEPPSRKVSAVQSASVTSTQPSDESPRTRA
jgi:hypothetical protein